jgi:predicted kinase
MGSGKTTKSHEIANETGAVLISEDEWLSVIYPDEIKDFDGYLKYSSRIKKLLKSHVQNILNSGVSVVMDFPANTKDQRQWFKNIYSEYGIPHRLVYLEASDQLCLKQIKQRTKISPERKDFDTEEIFHQVNAYFQAPDEDEIFNIEVISRESP